MTSYLRLFTFLSSPFLSCHWQQDYFFLSRSFAFIRVLCSNDHFCYLLACLTICLHGETRSARIGKCILALANGLRAFVRSAHTEAVRCACHFNCSSIILIALCRHLLTKILHPNGALFLWLLPLDYSIIYHFTSVFLRRRFGTKILLTEVCRTACRKYRSACS